MARQFVLTHVHHFKMSQSGVCRGWGKELHLARRHGEDFPHPKRKHGGPGQPVQACPPDERIQRPYPMLSVFHDIGAQEHHIQG